MIDKVWARTHFRRGTKGDWGPLVGPNCHSVGSHCRVLGVTSPMKICKKAEP